MQQVAIMQPPLRVPTQIPEWTAYQTFVQMIKQQASANPGCRHFFPLLFVDSLLECDLDRVLHGHALDVHMFPAVGLPDFNAEGVELLVRAL